MTKEEYEYQLALFDEYIAILKDILRSKEMERQKLINQYYHEAFGVKNDT